MLWLSLDKSSLWFKNSTAKSWQSLGLLTKIAPSASNLKASLVLSNLIFLAPHLLPVAAMNAVPYQNSSYDPHKFPTRRPHDVSVSHLLASAHSTLEQVRSRLSSAGPQANCHPCPGTPSHSPRNSHCIQNKRRWRPRHVTCSPQRQDCGRPGSFQNNLPLPQCFRLLGSSGSLR